MPIEFLVIVQARMGSSRLPGKSMKKIGKWKLIELVLRRIEKARNVDKIVLATTNSDKDDDLAKFVESIGFTVFRGSEDDVLSRYYNAAKMFNPYAIVRITGDCPLISPELVDKSIMSFKSDPVDYLRIAIGNQSCSYPRGFDVEIAKFSALKIAAKQAKDKYQREHVMPYLYENPELFKIRELCPEKDFSRPNYRLCVDTIEDFRLIEHLYTHFNEHLLNVDYKKIIHFLDKHPEIASINQKIKQKEYTEIDERFI